MGLAVEGLRVEILGLGFLNFGDKGGYMEVSWDIFTYMYLYIYIYMLTPPPCSTDKAFLMKHLISVYVRICSHFVESRDPGIQD